MLCGEINQFLDHGYTRRGDKIYICGGGAAAAGGVPWFLPMALAKLVMAVERN
jgi:hypothetical protein